MQRLLGIFIIFFIFLNSTIANAQISENKLFETNPESFIVVPWLGIHASINHKNEIEIDKIKKNSPAEYADININDVISEIDGAKIESFNDLTKKIIFNKKVGDNVSLRIRRGNQIIESRATLGRIHIMRDLYEILKLTLINNIQMRLAILTGEINTTWSAKVEQIDNWKKGISSLAISSSESQFFEILESNNIFQLIDRRELNKILSEQKIQSSGLVLAENRRNFGKLLGATHMMIIDVNRFIEGKNIVDHLNRRLIDVESGRTIISISLKYESQSISHLQNKSSKSISTNKKFTMEMYNRIQNGMSYKEVVEIIGADGTEQFRSESRGRKHAKYVWKNDDHSGIYINFRNDKVYTKHQIHLE